MPTAWQLAPCHIFGKGKWRILFTVHPALLFIGTGSFSTLLRNNGHAKKKKYINSKKDPFICW